VKHFPGNLLLLIPLYTDHSFFPLPVLPFQFRWRFFYAFCCCGGSYLSLPGKTMLGWLLLFILALFFFFFWVQLYLFMSQLGVFRYCFFKRCDMNAFVSFA
jgi:hypothetical protein